MLVKRLKRKYCINIAYAYHYAVYKKYKFSKNHAVSKAEATLVESVNTPYKGHYLARLNRKTMSYSKVLDRGRIIFNAFV